MWKLSHVIFVNWLECFLSCLKILYHQKNLKKLHPFKSTEIKLFILLILKKIIIIITDDSDDNRWLYEEILILPWQIFWCSFNFLLIQAAVDNPLVLAFKYSLIFIHKLILLLLIIEYLCVWINFSFLFIFFPLLLFLI